MDSFLNYYAVTSLCSDNIPPTTVIVCFTPIPANIICLNTFGCIVVVTKEAVVDFPGVTLLLH